MRLFHTLKDADTALAMFKDEKLDGFFDQLISYQLLLDLLYELGRYQDILDTYKVIKERQVAKSNHYRVFPYNFPSPDSRRTIPETRSCPHFRCMLQTQHSSIFRVRNKLVARTQRSRSLPNAPRNNIHGPSRHQARPTSNRLGSHFDRETAKLLDHPNHQSLGVRGRETIRRCRADPQVSSRSRQPDGQQADLPQKRHRGNQKSI